MSFCILTNLCKSPSLLYFLPFLAGGNKNSYRAKNLAMSSIIQCKGYFNSAASCGAGPVQGLQLWHSQVMTSKRTHLCSLHTPASIKLCAYEQKVRSLISCHLVTETSNYAATELINCHAWPCWAVRAFHTLKWAGLAENCLISEGTATLTTEGTHRPAYVR